MIRKSLLLLFFLVQTIAYAFAFSSIEGHWEGTLEFRGTDLDIQLDIKISGIEVSGFSHLSYPNKKAQASFEFHGYIHEKQLFITEKEQLSGLDVEWCLKEMKLGYSSEDYFAFLQGNWRSAKCGTGNLKMKRKKIKPIPYRPDFTPLIDGTYSGHLSQSDRDYGFYFQMTFHPLTAYSGNGISHIVSEEAGGSAYHLFNYQIDSITSILEFTEEKVIYKTITDWIWCLKQADLSLENRDTYQALTGSWSGELETSGACAPGTLELEQYPEEELEVEDLPYENLTSREADAAKIIETTASKLKLRIWDNNVVDGDVVSLYLNDDKILENCRINKYKRPLSIELKNKNNYLILHAENLGKVSPNTTAIEISDDEKSKIFVLSSDFKKSGAIVIKKIDDF